LRLRRCFNCEPGSSVLDAITVLSTDRVLSHSSVKLCDLEILWWLDLIAISVLTVHKVVHAFEA
jgi:hypothetical protein